MRVIENLISKPATTTPRRITISLSARRIPRSCVTRIADRFRSRTGPRTRSRRRAWAETSRPPVGSRSTSLGNVKQVAGDLQALPHTAGKGGRSVVDPIRVVDFGQQVDASSRILP